MVSSKVSSKSKLGKGAGGVIAASTLTDLSSPTFFLPFFAFLSIETETAIASPFEYVMPLPIGKINRVWVEFPKGCSGLVGMQIHRATQQIFPLPDGLWMRSDNAVLNFALTHSMATEPYEVTIKAYNLDDTYNHTIWIGFEMSGLESELSANMQAFIRTLQG